MPLKESHGNMYDWVSHVHTHLGGECPHKCSYCYVGRTRQGRPEKYSGDIRLIRKELDVNYGSNRIIFVEHMNDLFADGVPSQWIWEIINHCKRYPTNQYVFQTKNPQRALKCILGAGILTRPENVLMGTTIETNRDTSSFSRAPYPLQRFIGIMAFSLGHGIPVFVTIEPIMDFDVPVLVDWMTRIKPSFVNIGADSKGCGLKEPPKEKVNELIKSLTDNKIVIRKKLNLERLIQGGKEPTDD